MKLKLRFMLPNIKAAVQARNKLLLATVPDSCICFLAKPDTELGELKPAAVFDRSDSIQQALRGVYTGAGLGLIAGLLALAFPPWYVNAHWFTILAITTLFGAVCWTILMAIVGGTIFNSDLNAYKARIEKGEVMMFVTVPFYRAQEVRRIVANLKYTA